MSFFRIFQARGTNAETSIIAKSGFNEVTYIERKFKCGGCGKRGKMKYKGHAIFVRKQKNGTPQVFDLKRANCSCGHHQTFWLDVTGITSSHFVESADACEPDGVPKMLSGHDPLPDEARHFVDDTPGVICLPLK